MQPKFENFVKHSNKVTDTQVKQPLLYEKQSAYRYFLMAIWLVEALQKQPKNVSNFSYFMHVFFAIRGHYSHIFKFPTFEISRTESTYLWYSHFPWGCLIVSLWVWHVLFLFRSLRICGSGDRRWRTKSSWLCSFYQFYDLFIPIASHILQV